MRTVRALGGRTILVAVAAMMVAGLALPISAVASPSLDSEEIAFCTLINDHRAANGLAPLKVSQLLNNSSDWHTDDMAAKNYFSHTDSLGRDPFARMSAFGYTFNTDKGENIAAGNTTALATFNQWKNSPGHNANMLNPNFKVMGIARSNNTASTYNWYWNNSFGGLVDSSAVDCGTSPPVPAPVPAPVPVPVPAPVAGAPAASINDVSFLEGLSGYRWVNFTISLSKPATATTYINYATVNGTAISGSDFLGTSGRAAIVTGRSSTTVSILVLGDRLREPNEYFTVKLSTPVNATIADAIGVGTIVNDD